MSTCDSTPRFSQLEPPRPDVLQRWTGYNGSHVWDAIYNENCFEQLGTLDEMCYEERVLYRLLSGMHASINIHISLSYFPPSKVRSRGLSAPLPLSLCACLCCRAR
eukprot:763179-Hanusia_phi.AAC.2